MKFCSICGKSLTHRRRKVTAHMTMRCYDCSEADINFRPETPASAGFSAAAHVAKPNYVTPDRKVKKRDVQPVEPAVNGAKAKPKHYVKRKKKAKKHPVIKESNIKKGKK